MNRVAAMTLYLTLGLFRSVAGLAPLSFALIFGLVAFEYGMGQEQFITVGGLGTGALCFLTTLLLAGRANRAASYPLVARLRDRSELLTSAVVGGVGVTAALALLITVASLLMDRLTLHFPSLLWILPTWAVLWLMLSSLALTLSSLVSHDGWQVLGYILVVGMLVANDRQSWFMGRGLGLLVRAVDAVLWPPSKLLSQATAGGHGRIYYLALAATLAYAILLFTVAARFLETKDLLWAD